MAQTFWHLLARTWSAVAFFHPGVQERGIWWEDVLMVVLPDAAAVADEPLGSPGQVDVLQRLLASLDDNATCLRIGPSVEAAAPRASHPNITYETLPGAIASVRVQHWFDFRIAPGYVAEWDAAIHSLNGAIERAGREGATALILDFRETQGDMSEDSERQAIYGRMRRELVARLARAPLALPATARVQRVGYHDPAETGGSFGAYWTEWVTRAADQPVAPVADAFKGPLAILTGPGTHSLLEPALLGLQQAGRAIGVGRPGLAYHPHDQLLPLTEGITLQLRRHVLMGQGHPARYAPDIVTDDALAAAIAALQRPERPRQPPTLPPLSPVSSAPAAETLPARPQRLLAAIKLWTAVRTFSPYREHLARWEAALPVAIAEVAAAETRADYFQACQRLMAHGKGRHNFVIFRRAGTSRFAATPGGSAPRLRLARVGGAVTVVGPVDPALTVQPGDVLIAVDGEPITAREARLRPLFAHWPAGAVDHGLLAALLDSVEGACLRLHSSSAGAAPREVVTTADGPVAFVTEPVAVSTLRPWCLFSAKDTAGEVIGYLDASRVTLEHLPAALEELAPAAGLIVDLRRYPTLPVPFTSLRRFMRHPVPVPPMQRPVLAGPEQGIFGWLENRFYDTDALPPVASPDQRPLAALIGGGTVSMGEDWAWTLRVACGATLVGSVTGGGVGTNAFVHLPGGGRASFSGSYVRKGPGDAPIDGHGIMPDIVAEPAVNDGDHDAVVFLAAATLREVVPKPQ